MEKDELRIWQFQERETALCSDEEGRVWRFCCRYWKFLIEIWMKYLLKIGLKKILSRYWILWSLINYFCLFLQITLQLKKPLEISNWLEYSIERITNEPGSRAMWENWNWHVLPWNTFYLIPCICSLKNGIIIRENLRMFWLYP